MLISACWHVHSGTLTCRYLAGVIFTIVTIIVCTKFHGNPSKGLRYFSWDQSGGQTITAIPRTKPLVWLKAVFLLIMFNPVKDNNHQTSLPWVVICRLNTSVKEREKESLVDWRSVREQEGDMVRVRDCWLDLWLWQIWGSFQWAVQSCKFTVFVWAAIKTKSMAWARSFISAGLQGGILLLTDRLSSQ